MSREVILCLLLTPLVARSADVPFTVDRMLRNESIGRVVIDASGRRAVFQHGGPYEDNVMFGRGVPFVDGTQRLQVVDLESPGEPRPLFPQDSASSYALCDFSPDGRYVAFIRSAYGVLVAGVYDFQEGSAREVDVVPDIRGRDDATGGACHTLWISRDEFVLAAMETGQGLPPGRELHVEAGERQAAEWRKAWQGRQSTASPFGSGRYAQRERSPAERRLVIANAAMGTVKSLATGDFVDGLWRVSTDGRALAAVRVADTFIFETDRPLPFNRGFEALRMELEIFDLSNDGKASVCTGCDVLPYSITWSRDGRQLAFFARERASTWNLDVGGYSLWVHDRVSGRSRRLDLDGFSPALAEDWLEKIRVRMAWLDRGLVLQVRAPTPGWYLLRGTAAPKNLTAAFGTVATELVGVRGDELILASEGEIWAVHAEGRRRNLTAKIPEAVSVVREQGFSLSKVGLPGEISGLTLRSAHSILFLDLTSQRVQTVSGFPADGRLKATSPNTARVVFASAMRNVESLAVRDARGVSRELTRINRHLEDVAEAPRVRIDHVLANGERRTSWLLVPPGHDKSGPLPTVAFIYPTTEYTQSWVPDPLSKVDPLSAQLLAGQGYAVLLVSLPRTLRPQVPLEPLEGLAAQVLSAVDAAIAMGYVDGKRLAIQGWSYGGYGTMGVIGQTDRFRAAITFAGVFDLFGYYGQYNAYDTLIARSGRRILHSLFLAEQGQIAMGAPPWRDPQRYVRNSPLTYVESIRTPVMLVHGDKESNVPIAQSEEMFTALHRLNKDAIFVRYGNEDHALASAANIRDLWARIFAFYAEHLGPPH